MNFVLVINGKKREFFDDQVKFSARLGFLKHNKIGVTPFAIVPDSTKKNGTNWVPYSQYKKLKKEGVYG